MGTWDLSSAIRDWTCVPFSRSLNHWTAKEVPSEGFLIIARLTYTNSVFTKTKPAPNSPCLYDASPSLPDSSDPKFPWLWLSWHSHPKILKGGRYSSTPFRDSSVQASQNNPDSLGIPACCKLPPTLGANYCRDFTFTIYYKPTACCLKQRKSRWQNLCGETLPKYMPDKDFPVAHMVKNPPAMQETRVRFLG